MELRRLRKQAHDRHPPGSARLELVARRMSERRNTRAGCRTCRQAACPLAGIEWECRAISSWTFWRGAGGSLDRIATGQWRTLSAASGGDLHSRQPTWPRPCCDDYAVECRPDRCHESPMMGSTDRTLGFSQTRGNTQRIWRSQQCPIQAYSALWRKEY